MNGGGKTILDQYKSCIKNVYFRFFRVSSRPTVFMSMRSFFELKLTGAVLVISVPSDGRHEADGRQDGDHALEAVIGASVLAKRPMSTSGEGRQRRTHTNISVRWWGGGEEMDITIYFLC